MRKGTVLSLFKYMRVAVSPEKAQEPDELEAPSIEKMVMRFSNLMEILYFMMYALLATYLPSWKNRHAMYYANHVQSVVGQPNC